MTDKTDLVERLHGAAENESAIMRNMAEAKSLRQAGSYNRKDLYLWPTPEQTFYGQAAARITELEAKVAAMETAGEAWGAYAGHDSGCRIMTHGVWSDPIPCTCGYSDAVKAWREVCGES